MRLWRKGNHCVLLVGMQTGAAAMENSMNVSQKIKHRTTYDPATPALGVYLKKMKMLIWKDIRTPLFTAALFTTAKTLK